MSWTQISGSISALPARRGEELGTYLWIDAGVRHEHVVAELYLPAVSADDLDGALGVATGSVHTGGDDHTVRYFPDKLPIGMQPSGEPHVFVYLVTHPSPTDFRMSVAITRVMSRTKSVIASSLTASGRAGLSW